MNSLLLRDIKIDRIMKMIPHRYPFLLIDRIIEVIPDQGAIALKNVTINENHFCGHFPENPVMPGVLIVEAMAQTSAAFVALTMSLSVEDTTFYFTSIDHAHFRKPVIPGDVLYLHIQKIKNRGNLWKMKGEARVDDIRVADAAFSAMVINKVK